MKVFKLESVSTDERGDIFNILPSGVVIKSALYITGAKGAIRGSHYHKKDEHYCLILSGKVQYRGPGGQTVILSSGDIVHTPKGEKHKFTF